MLSKNLPLSLKTNIILSSPPLLHRPHPHCRSYLRRTASAVVAYSVRHFLSRRCCISIRSILEPFYSLNTHQVVN
ncbi:unnamed protein product [Trifolium pratense]|uniref:Uncharacterized protein n=1 Tax=Trifolium pratense TaxID=57577 RepID=A0ACB0LEE1_TRIPR|nr:unnamed protein product [Trifolium pratense]